MDTVSASLTANLTEVANTWQDERGWRDLVLLTTQARRAGYLAVASRILDQLDLLARGESADGDISQALLREAQRVRESMRGR